MAKSFNMSKFKSEMNKIQREARKIKRQWNQGVNLYNREVGKINSNLRNAQSKIQRELTKMQSTFTSNSSYYISTRLLHDTYIKINECYNVGDVSEEIFNAIENEDANNLELSNVVLNNDENNNQDIEINESHVLEKLVKISDDLADRWRGAMFSLNPMNPEAARHFCTSTREILKFLIDDGIKNKDVLLYDPGCEKTKNGDPTRKAKIKYSMNKKGIRNNVIVEFVDNNIENVVSLINELSNGTHGHANRYTLNQLKSFKKRFEDSIDFVFEYVI